MSDEEIFAVAGLIVTQGTTTPTKLGKQPRPVWTVAGNINPYKEILYELGGNQRYRRGTFTFWEDPTEALTQAIQERGRTSFAKQQEAIQERAAVRAERLEERAQKHANSASTVHNSAKEIADGIPPGQPILVGHHSERRHRRDINKIHALERKSIDELDYATHLQDRANTSQRIAEGKHLTLEYVGNRLEEARAALNKIERQQSNALYLEGKIPKGDRRTYLENQKAEYEEQIAYWEELYAQKGGDQYSSNTITTEHQVRINRQWVDVLKVNRKTVKVTGFFGFPRSMDWNEPYHKITGVRPKSTVVTPDCETGNQG